MDKLANIRPLNELTNLIVRQHRGEWLDNNKYKAVAYNSPAFAAVIRDKFMVEVLRKIENRQIANNLGEFIEVLAKFGTAWSYSKLARLIFGDLLLGVSLSNGGGTNNLNITLDIVGGDFYFVTADTGENITTQENENLTFAVSGGSQQRRDYEFLVKELTPYPVKATVIFQGVQQ